MQSACLTRSICDCGSRGRSATCSAPDAGPLRAKRNCEWKCAFGSLVSANPSERAGGSEAFPALAGPDARRTAKNPYEQEPRASPRNTKDFNRAIICWIDEPLNWRRVTRRFRLAGWCFSKNSETIEGLRACIGDHQFIVSHGLARPDVARIHPDQAGRAPEWL